MLRVTLSPYLLGTVLTCGGGAAVVADVGVVGFFFVVVVFLSLRCAVQRQRVTVLSYALGLGAFLPGPHSEVGPFLHLHASLPSPRWERYEPAQACDVASSSLAHWRVFSQVVCACLPAACTPLLALRWTLPTAKEGERDRGDFIFVFLNSVMLFAGRWVVHLQLHCPFTFHIPRLSSRECSGGLVQV